MYQNKLQGGLLGNLGDTQTIQPIPTQQPQDVGSNKLQRLLTTLASANQDSTVNTTGANNASDGSVQNNQSAGIKNSFGNVPTGYTAISSGDIWNEYLNSPNYTVYQEQAINSATSVPGLLYAVSGVAGFNNYYKDNYYTDDFGYLRHYRDDKAQKTSKNVSGVLSEDVS